MKYNRIEISNYLGIKIFSLKKNVLDLLNIAKTTLFMSSIINNFARHKKTFTFIMYIHYDSKVIENNVEKRLHTDVENW